MKQTARDPRPHLRAPERRTRWGECVEEPFRSAIPLLSPSSGVQPSILRSRLSTYTAMSAVIARSCHSNYGHSGVFGTDSGRPFEDPGERPPPGRRPVHRFRPSVDPCRPVDPVPSAVSVDPAVGSGDPRHSDACDNGGHGGVARRSRRGRDRRPAQPVDTTPSAVTPALRH